MSNYEPRAAAFAFAKRHADAVADLHTAQLNLKIFEATAFLGCDVGTIKEREMFVQSDPAFKKLSTAVIKARRKVQFLEDGIRASEAIASLVTES
jgi:hypothetical protein